MSAVKSFCLTVFRNKYFCLAWLVFGCAYFTWYGFLKDPMLYTASMIGLDYPWGFKLWGLFQSISIALNVLYMYRRYGYQKNRAGKICLLTAFVCITICVMIPSTEIFSFQLVAHWSTALLFGVFNALAIGLFLIHFAKQSRGFFVTLVAFLALLATMIVLLIVVGKSGAIENIPMWGAYLVLLLANFTGLYKKHLPQPAVQEEPAREAVQV